MILPSQSIDLQATTPDPGQHFYFKNLIEFFTQLAGIQYLNSLTEPMISRYTQILDHKLDALINRLQPLTDLSIKEINNLYMLIRTRVRKLKWDHTGNIFNHLASQWLIQNLPVHEHISSFEHFASSLAFYKPFNMTPNTYEQYLLNFYKSALSVWIQLRNPSLEEVQLAVLEIVAKAINMNMRLERETFAQALYDILLVLINRKNEIITEDNFVKLMRNYLGILWKEQPAYYKACSEYYEFAKHFILIDFPNKKASYFKNFHAILQGKIAYFSDHALSLLEKLTQKAYIKVVKKRRLDSDDYESLELLYGEENLDRKNNYIDFQKYLSKLIIANSSFARTKVLLTKVFQISEALAIDYWTSMRKYEIFKKFDRVVGKTKVYDMLGFLSERAKILKLEFVSPRVEKAQVYALVLKDRLLLKFENFRNLNLKALSQTLKTQIEFLRESMLIFYDGMIEMRFSRFSLGAIYTKIKVDIGSLYKGISGYKMDYPGEKGNAEENGSSSMTLYQNCIRFFQKRGARGRRKEKRERNGLEEIQEESKELIKDESKDLIKEDENAKRDN